MNRYISLCWEETVRCDGQIIQIQYRLSYVTIQGAERKKSHMTAMVITCNTVLTSRACSFLTLYFLQMFYYIYINTFIHSTVIPWSETEIKSLTLSLNAKNFGKDEKSRDQSRQVNNYKANAYKGGITQVHR